jgi:hypothetical protein
MTFLLGFWIGLGLGVGGYWAYANPEGRKAFIEKIKSLFRR